MYRFLSLFVLLLPAPFALGQESADEPARFTPEQIRADFGFLYEGLQSANYDLYAFTPRSEFDARYREFRAGFVEPMTRFEAEMAFQRFAALARQSHTRIESDYSGYFAYRADGGAGFPLEIAVAQDRLTVTGNSSGVAEIGPGDRITAINGREVTDLLPRLTAHISAETVRFGHVLLERYLPLVLWLELGPAEAYAVSIDHTGGGSGTYDLSPPGDREPDAGKKAEPFSLQGREARMLTETVAYLRPGPFYNTDPEGNSLDATSFLEFTDAAFRRFIENGSKQLILDLRDNPGGDNSFSDPVIAWFADRPFRFSSDFRIRISPESTAANEARLASHPDASNSISQRYAELYASAPNGKTVSFPIPEVEPRPAARYEGQVFVLVNRYSFSNAVSAAALIQDYGFGVIMGETTVDMATTYGAMERFTLPETGIVVTYPKALIVRPNGDDSIHPVRPDVPLPSPRLRGPSDVMLEAALEHI